MDGANNVLVNTALVVALSPILAMFGQVLKNLPGLRAAPEWLPLVNAILGAVIAVWVTIARGMSASVPATAMELTVAALSGAMAGYASGKVHDAAVMTFSQRQPVVRTRQVRRQRGRTE